MNEAVTRYVVELERTVIPPETDKRLMMKKNKEPTSCSMEMTTSDGRNTDKLLNHIPLLYLVFGLNIESPVPRYCNREVSETIPFISEQKRN